MTNFFADLYHITSHGPEFTSNVYFFDFCSTDFGVAAEIISSIKGAITLVTPETFGKLFVVSNVGAVIFIRFELV